MFEQNFNSQTTERKSINTHIETLFSDISYLKIACWNEKISFEWTPAGPISAAGKRTYTKDARVSTALSHEKVEGLLRQYVKVLKPLIDSNADPGEKGKCVGVTVQSGPQGATTLTAILIEYLKGADGRNHCYFSVVKNANLGAANAEVLRYEFKTCPVVIGSRPEAGEFTEIYEQGELSWFLKLLDMHGNVARYNQHALKYASSFAPSNNGNNGIYNQNSGAGIGVPGGFDVNSMTSDSADFSVFS